VIIKSEFPNTLFSNTILPNGNNVVEIDGRIIWEFLKFLNNLKNLYDCITSVQVFVLNSITGGVILEM